MCVCRIHQTRLLQKSSNNSLTPERLRTFVAAASAVGEVSSWLLRLERPTALSLLRPQDQVPQWSQSRTEDCTRFWEGCWSSVSVGSLETLVPKISKGTISRGSSINQLLYPGSQATEKALLRYLVFLLISDRSTKTIIGFSSFKIFLKARGESLLIYLYNQSVIKKCCKHLSPISPSATIHPSSLTHPHQPCGYQRNHSQHLMGGPWDQQIPVLIYSSVHYDWWIQSCTVIKCTGSHHPCWKPHEIAAAL